MKYRYLVIAVWVFGVIALLPAKSQTIASGTMASEATSLSGRGINYLVMKHYTSSSERALDVAGMPSYLDLPLEISRVTTHGNSFTSVLYAMDSSNTVQWTTELGRTNSSWPTGIALDKNDAIYTGEKDSTGLAVNIVKIDKSGKRLWTAKVDSVQTIHAINSDAKNSIVAICSFTVTKQVVDADMMHYENHFVYFTVRINKQSGSVASKTYSAGPTWFGQNGFSTPTLNIPIASFMYKEDSLLYFRVDTVQIMRLSAAELKGWEIKHTLDDGNQYYVIAQDGRSSRYRLLVNRFAPGKELQKHLDMKKDDAFGSVELLDDGKGGVVVAFRDHNHLELARYDSNLDLLWSKSITFKEASCDAIISMNRNSNNEFLVYMIKQNAVNRQVIVAVVDENGELKD